jgi:broad specificity phosphatase PhoE
MQENALNSQQKDHSNENTPKDLMVWFIRHGESEAHIGKAATHTEEVRLTKAGKQQAEEIASILPRAPNLVISSPYLRAWETAAPTFQRFPNAPHKIWPVQEFTYLGSLAGICSTKHERRAQVEEYWQRGDPTYHDGNGESFAQFLQRVRTAIDNLKHLDGFVTIFTHEQFIRAAQGLLHGWLEDSPAHMERFRQLLVDAPLPYGYTLHLPVCSGQERFWQIEHIPRSTLTAPTRR